MSRVNINIMDLPDEMILAIWNKLSKIDVLYSFVGVHQRFNRLVFDKAYIQSIELINLNSKHKHLLTAPILDRFCSYILPQAHQFVESLTLESISMERVLSVGTYHHLRKLTIIKIDQEFALRHFTDESPFTEIFKEQITHLKVSIIDPERSLSSLIDLTTNVFARIFSLFKNLTELDFGSTGRRRYCPRLKIFDPSSMICFSSNIVHLRISVDTMDECLCLLDDRLNYLRRFVVRVCKIYPSKLITDNRILTNLKSFSLSSYNETNEYDSQVVVLLRRMIFLEELTLHLNVCDRLTFTDATQLNNEVLIHMPRLQTLTFNIVTFIKAFNGTSRTTINNIQHTFYNGKNHQLVYYVDFSSRGKAQYHIYSIPYVLNDLLNISRNFPGGLFSCVHDISLMNIEFPFEHDFFLKISRCFPLLTHLFVLNIVPQQHKRTSQLNATDQISSIVEFPHLTNFRISSRCIDYMEQFLIDTNTRLPHLVELNSLHEHLVIVTENFTRDATRRNCVNVEHLIFNKLLVHFRDFYLYFPNCK
ncbi:unnamed protein product [Rotaria magnacalcarata]|uniref:F-box domain-containing protein n=3 Tax=Rotaria magnacalcarata TaxID=392030 RepID=A0A820CHQ1_9BILA|nr:unnamed protein product [Rotaria magnacalcarata]